MMHSKKYKAVASCGYMTLVAGITLLVASNYSLASTNRVPGTGAASSNSPITQPAAPPVDRAATMLATLQKQLAEQQALLRQLQENMSLVNPGVAADVGASVPVSMPEPAVSVTGVPAVPGTAQLSSGGTVVTGEAAVPASPTLSSPGASGAPSFPGGDTAADVLQTAAQRQAYASGVSVWRDIESSMAAQRSMGIELDPQWVIQGLQDMAAHAPLKISNASVDTIMVTLNEIYMEKAHEVREHQLTMGRVFQSAFMKEKGAVRDAGSLYRVVEAGQSKRIRASDVVTFSVTGTLPDGTVFDTSGQSGHTKTAKVSALMPAVAIGLQKIGLGGHIKVVVPPEKGYGEAGLPPTIPGGATLIFDITVADGE